MRILFAELTREESRAIARDGVLILPVGATEQHGPHLPVGTDSMGAEYVARAAAAALADRFPVAVAPTLWYGSSPHHLPFGGTMSLDAGTFLAVLMDLGRSLARASFRRLFIVNGHGGNHELIGIAARDLALEEGIEVAACSWWAMAHHELASAGAAEIGRLPGHAGAFESSIVLALDATLVREPRPHRPEWSSPLIGTVDAPVRIERPGSWEATDGFTDSPSRATAALGRTYLKIGIDRLTEAVSEFYMGSNAP
ncbi:MAG: creatininase family protein [bacterium]|nr:creatininase family protein [bacterium]MDE0290188.1 creatininase family protein [bacterium]MDE0440151.1 creatininase family protein [bacterium]